MNPEHANTLSGEMLQKNIRESNRTGVTIIAHLTQYDYGKESFKMVGHFVQTNNERANRRLAFLFRVLTYFYGRYIEKYGYYPTGGSVLRIEE